ncbi:sensor histidine kinase [Paenibacillus thiaminolyticus]|uniref:ATP-binding protein n=1 Tax=Paenibacillus thiaminolyticus TaxID=49283 RepID=UPI0035A69C32
MKKARSFKKELIYSFLIITFFSTVLLGSFQIYQLISLIKENKKSQAQTAKYLSDYISSYIVEHKKAIQTQAVNLKELFATGDVQRIQDHLKHIKTIYPGFVNFYVGDKNGQSIVFYPTVNTDGTKGDDLNFSDRSYYKELLRKKSTVISPVFQGRGGTDNLLVTIVSPIMNDAGEMIGYVLGALDLDALRLHIQNWSMSEEGYAVVLDHEKNVIVHPFVDTRKELVNLSQSQIVQHIEEQHTAEGSGFFSLEDPPEDVYITYEKIKPLDWMVWVGKSTDVLTSMYRNSILTIIIILFLTTVTMVGASLFLTNRLEKTIRQLLNYIKEYTVDFKVNHIRTKKIQGPKELEELFFYFNHMIDEVEKNRKELMELNKELEGRVQERTAILKHKNSELKAVNKLITSVSSNKDLAQFIQHCLQEMTPFINYSIHVLFHDLVVTNEKIHTKQNLLDYLNNNIAGKLQYIKIIQLEEKHNGFLVVDLASQQSISASEQEFLDTFSSSMGVMLQNKFLFEQIRSKNAVWLAVLESMSEGLMLVNNQKEVEYVNEFFLNVVANGEEHKVKNLNDVYERFLTLFDVDKEELSAFFTDENRELKMKHRQKSEYYRLHKFLVMLDDDRIGEGLLLRDITQEEEIDALKNNLISLTSHEFKTPITNIKGSIETLLRQEVEWGPEFQQELLEGVHEDIDRILCLVNDWMDISKIESGTMYVEMNKIRPDQVIAKSMEQIPLPLRRDAAFHFHNHLGNDFVLYADKLRVQQVLVNLYTNALRYNDAALKKIDVSLNIEQDYITVSVSDNGIGIAEDQLDKIFNHFYQVDATAARRTGGTGLGLAICVGIMEAHGGKIEVTSKPGAGSTFTLYFPIKKGEE